VPAPPAATQDTATRHASKFIECGRRCADAIAHSFKADVDFFGYPAPGEVLPEDVA
jgi:hypothetical protein